MRKGILKKAVSLSIAFSMIFAISGCDNSGGEKLKANYKTEKLTTKASITPQKEAVSEGFKTNYDDFAIKLFAASSIENLENGQNVLISPASVMSALGMTANGANGNTLSEMENVLNGGNQIDSLNKYMYGFMDKCTKSEGVSFKNANSIWLKADEKNGEAIVLKDDFIAKSDAYYNASLFKAPFDDSTVKDINLWVKDKTDEMIPKLLDEIPDAAVMYLINAMAFEGEWTDPFEEASVDKNGRFTNSKGEEETVNMLRGSLYSYLSCDDATGFIKYYKGNDYAFMAILPNEGISLTDYISNMTGEKFAQLYNSNDNSNTYIMIPEFTYDYDISLNDSLKELGIKEAFEGEADLTNMCEYGGIYIYEVLHKTHIELDRTGTKAAAVTSVAINETCELMVEEPHEVYLDRPFMYAIVDVETGLPIFIGAVNTIKN